MPFIPRLTTLMSLVVLLACVTPTAADDLSELFDSLYSATAKRVTNTRDKDDDIAFGSELLEAAKVAKDQPKFGALLCEKAYLFASREKGGYPTAIDAMQFMAGIEPTTSSLSHDNILQILNRIYGSAGSGQAKLEAGEAFLDGIDNAVTAAAKTNQWRRVAVLYRRAMPVATAIRSERKASIGVELKLALARQRAVKQIEELQSRLKANPTDSAVARQIVNLHVVELDHPKGAIEVAEVANNEATKLLPLTFKNEDDLSIQNNLDLANWYGGLAGTASKDSKPVMLRRAVGYFERFHELVQSQDPNGATITGGKLAILKAKNTLKNLEAQLDRLQLLTPGRLPLSLRKGLVLHYDFNKSAKETVKDKSGKGHHGKIVGARWMRNARGSGNAALEFDGRNNLIQISPKTLGNWTALTYSVWVRTPRYNSTSWPSFIGSHTTDAGWNTTIGLFQNSGFLRIEVDTDKGNYAARGTLAVPWNKWFHAAMVYDGKTTTEYINGVAGHSMKSSGKLKNVARLAVARDHPKYHALRGHVDDVMIFSRALSDKEIQQIYKAQRRK